jgi:hypothetical protein
LNLVDRPDPVRRLAVYCLGALLMMVLVGLSWVAVFTFAVLPELGADPAIEQQILELQKIYGMDAGPLWPDPDFARAASRVFEPVLARFNWLAAATWSSVIIYSILGLVVGRLAGESKWAGAFPVLGVVANVNPIFIPLEVEPLTFAQKAALLVLQVVVVQLAADQGAAMYWRQQR